MRTLISTFCALALTLTMAACDPGDDGDDTAADTGTAETGGEEGTADEGTADESSGGAENTFGESVAPILAASCSCHSTGVGGPLDFGDDTYAALVGVMATGAPLSYVEPGDVDASYLVNKVRGTQMMAGGGGSTMPLGGMLTEEEIVTIEKWIDGGAVE